MTEASLSTLEQLRLLPEDDRIQALLHRREDQWLERTGSRSSARHLADLLIGFANAEGGLITVGLHDGRVEGVSGSGLVNGWRQAAMDFTEPPVRHRFEMLPCTNHAGDIDEIVVIEVEASEYVHHNVKGETYLRIGDENRKLGSFEARELEYDKGQSVYDGSPVADAVLDDLDDRLVDRYLRRVRAHSPAREVLQSRGLVAFHDGVPRPTVAGLLVLGRSPQSRFPHAHLRLLEYHGASRETGSRANVARDVRIEGALGQQIDRAQRTLRRWLPSAIRLEEEGRFERASVIPEYAWLEAIVNALVHRSYTIGGDHVRVEVFADRLEVESPGRLPGLVRIENIRSTRFARNPRIARALADIGYGRELGEGVNRMFEEMERVGLPDPLYMQGPASVRVAFLADSLAGKVMDALPLGSERFVDYLSRTGRITTTQSVDLFGQSRPTVLGHLHRLAELGLIEHIGTSLKDPRGYWRLRRGAKRSE
ncbi:MAG: ATP-binding protein [Candidatus Limnocylindrales bacterium]|nr:ATP-binding protein [Candidatus Limnocylindrales bacterium]